MRAIALLFAFALAVTGQAPVAPSPDQAGSPRGETWSGYNIVDSFETGYRFASVGGNDPEYRSSVNFGNGIRLLSSDFRMNSKDGHGRFFDEMVITTQGLGNDPYEYAGLRISKNGLYRYDMAWRQNDYFNPGLTTDGGQGEHFIDTRARTQDHDLTIFPDGKLKFFLGFTGTNQTGPAYSSIQLFDSTGPITPLFTDLRRIRHEYRLGNEFRVFGVRVNWMHGWDNFKEDTRAVLTTGVPGIVAPVDSLTSFSRPEPYHGNSPYWRVAIFADRRLVNVNGRFTYTAGQRNFVVDESAIGPGIFGAAQNRQIVTSGNGQRPVATGNLNITLLATSKLTVTNSTSVYNVRTSGSSLFSQFDNATQSVDALYFNYLGIRTVSNETGLNYQFSPLFGGFAGYEYSNRRINSTEQSSFSGVPFNTLAEQTNQLHTARLGLRLRPIKPLSIQISGEIGRNDGPFTPIAERNYHALNGRAQYRSKAFLLQAGAESNYNFNSVTLSSFSSQGRKYFASGTWTPRDWLTLDASYSRSHLYTIGGIAYFADSNLVQGESSIFISNIHAGVLGARFAIHKRTDLYVGYTRVQDTGDGRSTPSGNGIGSALPAFQAAQTFPMSFQSPLARLSVQLHERVRWNVGYQYYGYAEDFYRNQGFRANTGYSSLSWSF